MSDPAKFSMVRAYSSLDTLVIDNLYNLLAQQEVLCEVRNRHARSAMGELPITEVFTELWVAEDDLEVATQLIRRALDDEGSDRESAGPTRKCERCGTEIEPNFDTCWKCAEMTADHHIEGRTNNGRLLSNRGYRWALWAVWIAVATLSIWWISHQ